MIDLTAVLRIGCMTVVVLGALAVAFMYGAVYGGKANARDIAECKRAVEFAEIQGAYLQRTVRLSLDTWKMMESGAPATPAVRLVHDKHEATR